MIIPVLSLLKGQGVPALRRLGLQALRHALKNRRAEVVGTALARLTRDGALSLLTSTTPQIDKDGQTMTPQELFAHDAAFALLRAIFDFDGGGRLADLLRDEYCKKHKEETAAALIGITDGREAVEKVLALMVAGL